jgi:Lrp/AsnC family leucine-responsive transcriptional regulator
VPTPPAGLDHLDRRIVQLLLEDARRTFGDIGARVGLSPSAVKRRIDRLERAGVIEGYTAIVEPGALGEPVEAFAELTFVGSAPVSVIESIAEAVPQIRALYTLAGQPDAIALVRAADVDDLKSAIDAIRRTGHVTGTKTSIVLGAVKTRRTLTPEA